MNFFKFMFVLSCWSFSNAAHPAVFFEYGEKKLVEVGKDAGEMICQTCLSACPATSDSPTLKRFNDVISLTGNALFSREVYDDGILAKEIVKEICDIRYTPGLVKGTGTKLDSFEVGYELLYKERGLNLTCDRRKYKKVDDKDNNLSEIKGGHGIDVKTENDNTVFCLDKNNENFANVEYTFYWINVLSIKMYNKQRHRIVTYAADSINDVFHGRRIKHKCEIYYSTDGKTILDANSQKELEQVFDGLVRAQIIPMHMFHTEAARLATCTLLNFAIVWEAIAKNQLKKIDLFLYALYREHPSMINLSFGVNGNLHNVLPEVSNKITFKDHPAPTVVFRYIRISLGEDLHYGAAVIVHNETSKDRIYRICSVEEELDSWDYLKNTDIATGISYVCPLTAEVVSKLEGNSELVPLRMKPLKISEFPVVGYENVFEKVEERFQNIKNMIL